MSTFPFYEFLPFVGVLGSTGMSNTTMSNINKSSIVTLVFFFLSTIFVIRPLSFHVRLPFIGRTKFTIGLMTAPLLAIIILWAAQCIGASQIRDGIVGKDGIKPYNILVLFISLAYMAITLDVTGILQAAAFWVSNQGGNNTRKLYFYFYILLTTISMFLGNDPVILSGTAFLVYYTSATGLDPVAWLISEFAAANTASMVLFVGNPTNVVICEGFNVNNAAFTAYTILPFIACNLACYAALAFQFRNPKHVPLRINVKGKLKPLDALLDPVGAIFGTILLLTCLVVVIVLSFFRVDVWKVVLPFAVTKFIFDLSWDHWRFTHGQLDKAKAISDGPQEDRVFAQLQRALSIPHDVESLGSGSDRTVVSPEGSLTPPRKDSNDDIQKPADVDTEPRLFAAQRNKLDSIYNSLAAHFPTFFTALPRLPFGLIPFAFSQFILIEGLAHQGWIDVFATWLIKATNGQIIPTIWLVGILGVILCNVAGTNIGATILLTKVVHAAPEFPAGSTRAAAIALAVASNIGAVSFTFSASLAGLLWKSILGQKGIVIKQSAFAFWNSLPLLVMTAVGLAIVTAEMAFLYKV